MHRSSFAKTLAWRPRCKTAESREKARETAAHRRERRKRTAARTLTRVASAAQLLTNHHSTMAPPQSGRCAKDKCFCINQTCLRTNFLTNDYCHVCGWQLPDNPIFFKPKSQPAPLEKSGGKGGAKGKGKGAGKNGGHKPADKAACSCCGGKGHEKADCRQRDKECHNCGKIGHISAVCRSKARADGTATAAALTDDAFAAECTRRNVANTQTAQPPAAEVEPEHTVGTITAKGKAKEEAYKKLLRVIDRKIEQEKALAKTLEDVAAAAKASQDAERAFKDEVAATHLSLAPAEDTTALRLDSFIDNFADLTKIKVDLGPDFDMKLLAPVDSNILQGKVDSMVADIAQHIHATIAPLKKILADARALVSDAHESAAKKRKGDDGAEIAAPLSPATHTCGTPAASSTASPTTPSLAEKELAAADKKATEAAAAAAAASQEAAKAKATADQKEKAAREHKATRELAVAEALKAADVVAEREAALVATAKEKERLDAEMDAV